MPLQSPSEIRPYAQSQLDERNGVFCLFVCLLVAQDPDTNILGGLSDEQRQTFRRQSVSMVTIERHVMPQLSTLGDYLG
jgi:hypothetical protein